MSDGSLNYFVAAGTAAEMGGFTPSPPTPAAGPDAGYFFFQTDTGRGYSWDQGGGAWVQINATAVINFGATLSPTGTPVATTIGYLGSPQNIGLDSAPVTLALTDSGKHFYHTDAGTRTLTIPANASIAFPIGTKILGVNENGAGIVTVAITSDTLRWGASTGSRAIAANGSFQLLKVAATVWRLTGDGIT